MNNSLSNYLYNTQLLIKYLLKRKLIIISAIILGVSAGIGFAMLKKIKYEASITFALDDSNDNLGGALSLVSDFGFNVGGNKGVFSGDNILQIITSRRIVESALLTVDTFPGEKNEIKTYVQQYLDITRRNKKTKKISRTDTVNYPILKPREKFTYLEDSVLFIIYKDQFLPNIEATRPDKKFGIYEVKYKGPEEKFSLEFTKKLLDLTKEFYIELKSKKSRQTLDVLENRVADMKGLMNSAIEKRAGYQDANRNPILLSADVPNQKRQADISVYGAAYTELFKNLEIARYQYLKDVPLFEIIDEGKYPLKKIKRSRLIFGLAFGIMLGGMTIFILACIYYLKNGFNKIKQIKVNSGKN